MWGEIRGPHDFQPPRRLLWFPPLPNDSGAMTSVRYGLVDSAGRWAEPVGLAEISGSLAAARIINVVGTDATMRTTGPTRWKSLREQPRMKGADRWNVLSAAHTAFIAAGEVIKPSPSSRSGSWLSSGVTTATTDSFALHHFVLWNHFRQGRRPGPRSQKETSRRYNCRRCERKANAG